MSRTPRENPETAPEPRAPAPAAITDCILVTELRNWSQEMEQGHSADVESAIQEMAAQGKTLQSWQHSVVVSGYQVKHYMTLMFG